MSCFFTHSVEIQLHIVLMITHCFSAFTLLVGCQKAYFLTPDETGIAPFMQDSQRGIACISGYLACKFSL